MRHIRNPYDRRERDRGGFEPGITMGYAHAPGVLDGQDLAALAGNAYDRGRRDENVDMQEVLHAGRRMAWDDGHTCGLRDAAAELRQLVTPVIATQPETTEDWNAFVGELLHLAERLERP